MIFMFVFKPTKPMLNTIKLIAFTVSSVIVGVIIATLVAMGILYLRSLQISSYFMVFIGGLAIGMIAIIWGILNKLIFKLTYRSRISRYVFLITTSLVLMAFIFVTWSWLDDTMTMKTILTIGEVLSIGGINVDVFEMQYE